MKSTDYNLLMIQVLSGKANDSEKELLEQWINSDPSNKENWIETELVWKSANQYSPTLSIDEDKAFARFSDAINSESKVKTLPKRNSFTKYIPRIAAVICLAFASLYFFDQYSASESQQLEIVTALETEEILLADQTKVWLKKGSSLKFPDSFDGNQRNVELEGEAYFEVAPNKEKPFIISTIRSKVEVLGTAFNLRDIAEEEFSEVAVFEGLVKFSPTSGKGEILTSKDETAIINHSSKKITKVSSPNSNALAWKKQKLVFVNTPLSDVFKDLERYFDVNISYTNKAIAKCPFNSPFTKPDINIIVKTLETAFKLKAVRSSEKDILFTNGSCK